jgi:hypothetical protein
LDGPLAMASLFRSRVRLVALIGVVPVALAGCGGSSRARNASTTAADHSLAHCIATWDADTSSEARAVVKTAGASGHTQGFLFTFKGGECGLTVGGLGPIATYADIGNTGHFEPWINTSNGSPAASILQVAESLAKEAESLPNVAIATDGSISVLSGAHVAQISQPVEIPCGPSLQPCKGSANSAPYNINAAAWNALPMQQKISVVSAYATQNSCSLEAVKQIALTMRSGTFTIQNNSVSSTLAQACANPSSIASSGSEASTASTESPPIGSARQCEPVSTGGYTDIPVTIHGGVTCSTARNLVTLVMTQGGHHYLELPDDGYEIDGWHCYVSTGLASCTQPGTSNQVDGNYGERARATSTPEQTTPASPSPSAETGRRETVTTHCPPTNSTGAYTTNWDVTAFTCSNAYALGLASFQSDCGPVDGGPREAKCEISGFQCRIVHYLRLPETYHDCRKGTSRALWNAVD